MTLLPRPGVLHATAAFAGQEAERLFIRGLEVPPTLLILSRVREYESWG